MKDFDRFHENLNRYSPGEALTRQDAGEAFHNLTGLMSLLIRINEREKIISLNQGGAGHVE